MIVDAFSSQKRHPHPSPYFGRGQRLDPTRITPKTPTLGCASLTIMATWYPAAVVWLELHHLPPLLSDFCSSDFALFVSPKFHSLLLWFHIAYNIHFLFLFAFSISFSDWLRIRSHVSELVPKRAPFPDLIYLRFEVSTMLLHGHYFQKCDLHHFQPLTTSPCPLPCPFVVRHCPSLFETLLSFTALASVQGTTQIPL
ncbi:uncharacterized protein LOC127746475 isoform X1 [Arachis duranensis]|uniref:Uncharacterized protein LOC127746475 isoform X1 n=1 Tax=Arachis duranensis TaxID=130453 RepID=A0A9C6WN78_ARADU|nr:uncharacterized protein LOC127746475 isoform X1 [Arachis duranensis]